MVRKLEQTVPIAQQRAADLRNLLQQNWVARHTYLEREQVRLEQEGDLATQRSRLTELDAAIRESASRRRELTAEVLAEITKGSLNPVEPVAYPLAEAARALTDLEERRIAGKAILVP